MERVNILEHLLPKLRNKTQLLPHLIYTAVLLCALCAFQKLFFQESLLNLVEVVVPLEAQRPAVFFVLLALIVLGGAAAVYLRFGKMPEVNEKTAFFIRLGICLALLVANAALSFFEIELINNYYLERMEGKYIVLGIGITLVLYGIAVLLLNSFSLAMIIGNLFFWFWGTVNYYVQSFRGIPFQWIDFGSIGTALSVSGNYDYTPIWQIVACAALTLLLTELYAAAGIKWNVKALKGRVISAAAGVALIASFAGVILHTDFLKDQGIWLRNWQPWYTYRLFGMESGFFAFAKASYPTAPKDYSAKKVKAIISETKNEEPAENAADVPENIIFIMNETFADLSVYPNLKTNTDVMPFLNEMVGAKNTQQGTMLVSVKGGTTANTEYEVLTGNSDVLSPPTVVYNSFIKDRQYSLATILGEQGYQAIAMHPYKRAGWNRNIVYPRMGFDEFYSIENYFEGAQTLRGFVSDEGDYDAMIDLISQKKEGEKLFLFNVTMQNHSPYTNQSLQSSVTIPDYNGVDKKKAEQYLTLMQYSDEALRKLVEYFSASDQKTLIVFWGDHQPEIGDDFWEYCLGKSMDDATFSEQQLMYETRYFIWANYDLPNLKDQMLSSNYLGSYVLSLTGLNKSGYQDFLCKQRELIPVMNAYGYWGRDEKWHRWNTADVGKEEEEALQNYLCLIYNELTANNSRDAAFFGVNGEK